MQDKTPQTENPQNQWKGSGITGSPNVYGDPANDPAFPPLGFWRLLVALFIYPRMALLNARVHKLWGKTLLHTLLITAIVAFVMAIQTVPLVRQQMGEFNDLFQETLGSLSFNPQTEAIGWTKDIKVPLTSNRGQWQLDVLDKRQDFNLEKARLGMQPGGIIVARDGLSLWLRTPQDKAIPPPQQVPTESLKELFQQLGKEQDGVLVIPRESLERLAPIVAPFTAVVMSIVLSLYHLKMILTCVGLFVIMSMLFNRAEKATFGAVCASSLACTLPPYALALLFSLVPSMPVSVDGLFTTFFIVYLVVILLDRSIVIRRISK